MMTDPRRARRTDPGDPERLPGVSRRSTGSTARRRSSRGRTQGCRTAGIGCLECKKVMIKHVLAELAPIRERRARSSRPDDARARARRRATRARARRASATMAEVRDAMGLRHDARPARVKLDLFEGPLDLLLHLIKKNEVADHRHPDRHDHRSVPGDDRGSCPS